MIYDVRHRTVFDYEQAVTEAHHVLHLMPRELPTQRRIAFVLHVDPEPTSQSMTRDYFGNSVHHVSLDEPHTRLTIESRSRVEVTAPNLGGGLAASTSWRELVSELAAGRGTALAAQQFVFESPHIAFNSDVQAYAAESFLADRPILEATMELTGRVHAEFTYSSGVSDVSTPVARVLELKKGVCQDFAHFQIACLRSLGLAARYVSGYLLTRPPPGQPRLEGADASHAWISVWAGELGWIDFDPTNDMIPRDEHVTVAVGRDYADVSPTNGLIVGGGDHKIAVAVDVSPIAAT